MAGAAPLSTRLPPADVGSRPLTLLVARIRPTDENNVMLNSFSLHYIT